MSHNMIRINGNTAAADGSHTVSLATLSDVEGTYGNGDVLSYDAATGKFKPASLTAGASFALFGRGESNNYSNTGFGTAVGQKWGFYDTNPTTCTGVTFNYVSGTSWLTSLTLAAGKWIIQAQHAAVFSSSGYLAIQIQSGTTVLSSSGVIGASLSTYAGNSTMAQTTLDLASSTTVTFNIVDRVGLAASGSQGNTPSEGGFVLIRKVL